MTTSQRGPVPAGNRGVTLPTLVFPQHPERLNDPSPDVTPDKRKWALNDMIAPRVAGYSLMSGHACEFHPITAYLFLEYKCHLDCWYCWSFDNKVKGMTEDVARRSIDWLHDNGCRVLALMGGEPLLRPDFVHKSGRQHRRGVRSTLRDQISTTTPDPFRRISQTRSLQSDTAETRSAWHLLS